MSEDLQRKIQSELDSFKNTQKELQKAISTRQQLDSQLNENMIVKDELEILPKDAKVYKSVGPVLIKTELVEARQNVGKRMDYIKKEISRVDDLITSIEKKQDVHREALQKLQHQFQQAQVKAALHA
ncbi:prefoldin subunit 6 [Tribolium castaneum]|uniref:Probable prefoldin subunit 6 n=1 Tax=Tribolium castaneum TaxID=7070 RepID=D6WIS5_TRICA|nr:PREDICTED: prefoldin subunit 6 [Tribolium castaneum]EEZ99517.1 putative prefoldin subunit 6-like Protein [Tribolium castaneum]|eukprot:XP_968086.1 PREDICTED: prefoldin subunit 6 [Tribolium castaneum]